MVHSCCVAGSSNRQDKEKQISLHRLSKTWRMGKYSKTITSSKYDGQML